MENRDKDTLVYRMAFASLRGMGYELACKILDVVPGEKDFFAIGTKEMRSLLDSKAKITDHNYRMAQLDKAVQEYDFVERNKVGVTYFTDDDYPTRLKNAPDSPILLYSKGDCDLNAKHIISVVGTRHATPYGQHFCDKLIEDLAENLPSLVVVSGLAFGIDVSAHSACLKHGVPTVGVLAHGLNQLYPAQHRTVAVNMIKEGGALLCDYMSQDVLHRGNFLARNRIVAALSDCTIVVESAMKGGAMVTASIAAGYNRDVFAVPGRVNDEFSAGCNKLIKNNSAQMISNADDLIMAMRWDSHMIHGAPKQLELFPVLSDEESRVVEMLRGKGEMHINELTVALAIPVYEIMSIMVELEFKGVVLGLPGSRYSLA